MVNVNRGSIFDADQHRRRSIAERAVWSLRAVFDPPVFDHAARVRHADEPMLVQTLVVKLSVEALDIDVLDQFAGPDERPP